MVLRERLTLALVGPLLLALMVLLLWQNQPVGQAVREGLALCAWSVIPSLFPFFVTVSLAVSCGLFDALRRLGLPQGAAVFLLGLIGGYPVGGRTIGELYRAGQLSRRRAARLLTFCNNAGPSFILSIVGGMVFGSSGAGLALYAIHTVSALAAGALLGGFRREEEPLFTVSVQQPPSLPAAFVSAVGGAALAMVNVCAFVVFFLAVAALLRQLLPGLPGAALGLLELTGGVTALPCDAVGFCTAAALLGWGGLSVHCQTAAVLEGTGIPMGRYLLAKAMQGILSVLPALLLCRTAA